MTDCPSTTARARAGRSLLAPFACISQEGPTTTAPTFRRRWHEGVIAACVMLVLCLVFFRDAVFLDRVLVPADISFALDSLWRDAAPSNFRSPINPLLSDQAYQMYPWRTYARYWLHRGELPLWNMTILGGVSLVGNDQSALFYPLNLLADLMPAGRSLAFTAIARLMIAGLGTYAYLRVLGRSIAAAYLGAIAFGFSGFLVVWLGHPHVNVAVWLPFIILCLELLFRSDNSVIVALLALAVGTQFLGGHIETSFHILLTAAAYGIFLTVRTWRRGDRARAIRGVVRSLVGVFLGFAIGSMQLLPFFEQLRASTLFEERAVSSQATPWAIYPGVLRLLITLPAIAFPTFLGSPLEAQYWAIDDNYNEYAVYVGTIPLVLAVVAARHSRGNGYTVFWATTAVICLAVAYRLPLFEGVNHLPVFRVVANGRLRLIVSFALAVLSASGMDRLLHALDRGSPISRHTLLHLTRMLTLGALSAWAVLIAVFLGLVVLRSQLLHFSAHTVEAILSAHPDLPEPRDYYVAKILPYYDMTVRRFFPGHLPTYAPVISALTLAAAVHLWLRGSIGTHVVRVHLPVATALELLLYGSGYNPALDPSTVFPPTPALDFLQSHAGTDRVAGLGFLLLPNSATLFNLQDIRGYEVVRPDRSWSLLRDIDGREPFGDYLLLAHARSPLLNLFGVRYVLASATTPRGDVPGMHPVFSDGATVVYENPKALPRAFLVPQPVVLPSANAARNSVRDPSFNPRDAVLLEAAQRPRATERSGTFTPATIEAYQPDRVVVRATPGTGGYLVLTDTYDDGWKALIDGVSAPIYRADYAFRAVYLEPGDHQIVFVYHPSSTVLGRWLLGVGLLGVVVAAMHAAWQLRSPSRGLGTASRSRDH